MGPQLADPAAVVAALAEPPEASGPPTGAPEASPAAWYGLGVLILVALFATVDGQIFGLVAEPLRKALGMSDTQLGLLQGVGGVLVLSLAAFPIGWLADRFDRRMVLAAGVLLWGLACLARGFAHSFDQLLAATIALSVGSAGLVPCIYGIIPTLFLGRKRLLANAIFVVVLYMGAAAGLALCGALLFGLEAARAQLPDWLRALDTWRIAFFVLGAPAPLVAIALLTIRLRRRDQAEAAPAHAAVAPSTGLIDYIRNNRASVAAICVGSGMIAFGATVRGWAPIIAARVFAAAPGEIGAKLGLGNAIGLCCGIAFTTFITRRYAARLGARFPLRVLWIGGLASASVSLVALTAKTSLEFFVLMGLQTAVETAGTMVSPGLLQDLAPTHLRSRMIAICVVVATAISAGGPPLVGAISDALKPDSHGLLLAAVAVGVVGTVSACLIFLLAERPYKRTVDALASA